MIRRYFASATAWWVCFLLIASAATAQNFLERIIMPGPLSAAHAKLETVCTNCHQAFSREAQNALCLTCHKSTASDMAARKGFHGRNPEIAGSQCRRCHTEHGGRDASIVFFTPELFDHAQTDFSLTGAHIGVACGRCHEPKQKFKTGKIDCFDCHSKDDPHKGELGEKCADCHVAASWSKTTPWPHTLWPLVGAHKQADCHSCHAGPRFVGLPKSCVGCHRNDDVHRGKLGNRCAKCHKSTTWEDLLAQDETP